MYLQNREYFLNKLSEKMGRPRSFIPEPIPTPLNNHATTRLIDLNQQQLCQEFVDFAKVMMVDVIETNESAVVNVLIDVCNKYGGDKIILNQDYRLDDLGITKAIQHCFNSHIWATEKANKNIEFAEKANIGIVYAEYGLAESGGIVLYSDKNRGRSVSLLPEKSIVIVRKSTILPRVAQLAQILHEKVKSGERMPSCINIISGPSSTADIELVKVVGVHGPTTKIYIVINDL